MKLSSILYLDRAFVVEAFEAIKNTDVPVRVTKTENIAAGLSVGIANAGASLNETKEFPINCTQMYEKIKGELKELPHEEWENNLESLPEYFWAKGVLGEGAIQKTEKNNAYFRASFLHLYSARDLKGIYMPLVINDSYFSTGYDQVQNNLEGSCGGFSLPIEGLFKYLCLDSFKKPICAPMIMYKTQNQRVHSIAGSARSE
jgi:hypothetical protein